MNAIDQVAMDARLKSAKRNVYILAGAQAILGAAAPLAISMGGLAGYGLLGADKSFATFPVTGFNAGTALGAVGIALVARQLGRKISFMLGAAIGACGGMLATIALFQSSFILFIAGMTLIGLSSGFTQKTRFAAADASPSHYKGRAISIILGAGIVSAILGPQLAILMKDFFAPVTFAGAFIMLLPMMLVGIGILSFVNLTPPAESAAARASARPLMEIVRNRRFITGMICGISSYSLMTFMMTGAPLAMVIGCGFSTELATLGIQWHVIAMFAPSFFTGMLITRFGAEKVVAAGLVILMCCAVVGHAGIELWNFWGALVLLGTGWNFGFIGATAIVASSYRPEEADKVQGFHDIVLFASVALSSASSGQVFTAYGWEIMNLVIWPVTLFCLALIFISLRKGAAKPASGG